MNKPKFVSLRLLVEVGDVLTSKKGALTVSELSGSVYRVRKMEVLNWNIIRTINKTISTRQEDYDYLKAKVRNGDEQ
jgi:hypothetical protein